MATARVHFVLPRKAFFCKHLHMAITFQEQARPVLVLWPFTVLVLAHWH